MQDIILYSVPYFEPTAPAAGPALLKGYLNTQGFISTACDLNVGFKKRINDPDIYAEMINYWTGVCNELQKSTRVLYHGWLDEFANQMVSSNSRWLGFGCFSDHSQKCLTDILQTLRTKNLGNTKIVVGGHGLDIIYVDSIKHLIDNYILGEGELALASLLRGDFSYPGINSAPVQIDDLDQLGFADYSDYDFTKGVYGVWYDTPMIQVTGSRGCVRDCSFCDVGSIWKKYRYRSGQHVAQEIITNHEKTGIRHFYFTDSLINGNVKQLMEMMRCLTEYKTRTGSDITWGGQWITRSQKGLPKDYYALMKSSGAFNITMGVETGSDRVRAHMKKNFTNADLDAELEQFSQHGISCGFFIMVGYPTETEEDFKDTLRMLKRYTKYVANGTIIGTMMGKGYSPLKNTPLVIAGKDFIYLGENKKKWVSTSTNSNYVENVRRRLIAHKVITNLKWPISNIAYEFRTYLRNEKILFDPQEKDNVRNLIVNKSAEAYPEFLAKSEPSPIQVSLILQGVSGIDCPAITVKINDRVYENIIVDGKTTLNFSVETPQKRNLIKITLTNKTDKDVLVQNDQIVRDKYVNIQNIIVDDVRLQPNQVSTYGKVKTLDQGWKNNRDGLYCQQDTYVLYFENPVHTYFIKKHRYYFEEANVSAMYMLEKVSHLFEEYVK